MIREMYIVDDNPDFHFLLYKAFKQFGGQYAMKFFEDGKVLHRHLNTLITQQKSDQLPGLIIVDLNMPGMNGLDLLKALRQQRVQTDNYLNNIPVVVMSNETRTDKIHQCYQFGADAYIVKPMELDHLKNTLQGICNFWLGRVTER
ncbi:response regulator [Dyadobacter sp.]|uniref:response regulator n=1 Tax=Dyadobacter sp. TaxID=1914288 RepID=UPI003F719DA8